MRWRIPLLLSLLIAGCSPGAFIRKQAKDSLFNAVDLKQAHIGITISDASNGANLFNYQGDKNYVPASNVKLFSCYAAMKYLGDTLAGIFYTEDDTAIYLIPSGDPSFLHPLYPNQPVVQFLKKTSKNLYLQDENWKDNALGFGWSWDDYNSYYMAERSALPVYGNVIKWIQERDTTIKVGTNEFDNSISIYSIPEINWKVRFNPDNKTKAFFVRRERFENAYLVTQGIEAKKEQEIPFLTKGVASALELLSDTIGRTIVKRDQPLVAKTNIKTIFSQPLDSLLVPMMHQSDNFFAEQLLLMVSQKILGIMNASQIIDTLLKTELKDLPQKPRWVDGSGLSRYNLISTNDFVSLLTKMQNEFGIERIKRILPTGGEGTLRNFYLTEKDVLFAKTGSLSNHLALSGFLYTKKNQLLIFSVIVNNHNGSPTNIRKHVESFLTSIRKKY